VIASVIDNSGVSAVQETKMVDDISKIACNMATGKRVCACEIGMAQRPVTSSERLEHLRNLNLCYIL
jgi:hypothetical protein